MHEVLFQREGKYSMMALSAELSCCKICMYCTRITSVVQLIDQDTRVVMSYTHKIVLMKAWFKRAK